MVLLFSNKISHVSFYFFIILIINLIYRIFTFFYIGIPPLFKKFIKQYFLFHVHSPLLTKSLLIFFNLTTKMFQFIKFFFFSFLQENYFLYLHIFYIIFNNNISFFYVFFFIPKASIKYFFYIKNYSYKKFNFLYSLY